MFDALGINTWDDFVLLLSCMAQVAAAVLPTAIAIYLIIYFIAKILKKVLTWLMGMVK